MNEDLKQYFLKNIKLKKPNYHKINESGKRYWLKKQRKKDIHIA